MGEYFEVQKREVQNTLAKKERIAGTTWLVIAAIQLFCGLFVNFWMLIPGVWNLIAGISRFKQAKEVLKDNPQLVEVYAKHKTQLIVMLLVNLFLSIFGVIGAIYDFTVRDYVLKNKDYFLPKSPAENDANHSSEEAAADTCRLILEKDPALADSYAVNPDIKVEISELGTYTLSKGNVINLDINKGIYTVHLSSSIRKKSLSLELKTNTKLIIGFNRITGGLETNVIRF